MNLSPRWHGLLLVVILLVLTPYHEAHAGSTDYYAMDENAIKHFHKSQTWMALRQYQAAIKELKIAIRLEPSGTMTATFQNNLGLAYLKTGNPRPAMDAFLKAIAIQPDYTLYYQNLTRAYQQSGTVESAIVQLQRKLQASPESPLLWYLLGLLYHSDGDKSAARTAFNECIRLAPQADMATAAKQYLEHDKGSQNGIR